MARKSRKETIQAVLGGRAVAPEVGGKRTEAVWNAGGYARLSILETRDRKDSEALSNQKALLREYITARPDLKFSGLYADNGETGTNFDRPAFQRLLADIKAKKINCVVVKDLSRFGRDYVEAGSYLERVFPFIGVRFISLNDNYDSLAPNAGDALKVALKNLVNEAYSKDISRKSGSVLRDKQRRGEFIGAYAAYGYLRDPADVHRLIVDEETAPVVREIFRRKEAGESDVGIVRWLNASGIPSPCVYRFQKGITLDKRYADGTEKPWMTGTVKNILKNQVYLGSMVQGRRRAQFFAGIPDQRVPPEQWVVVEGTHEAIIERAVFDRVQEIRRARREAYHANLGKYDYLEARENLFQGIIRCGDCGRNLVRYKEVVHGKRVEYRYICPQYAMLLEQSGCAYKYLLDKEVEDALSLLIVQEAALAVDAAALLQKQRRHPISPTALEIGQTESELRKLDLLRERLMRDFLAGVLEPEDRDRMKASYEREDKELRERLERLLAEKRLEEALLTTRNPWLTAFASREPVQLTRELVQALVERITVYAENRVEIRLKYRDERAALLGFLSRKEVSA